MKEEIFTLVGFLAHLIHSITSPPGIIEITYTAPNSLSNVMRIEKIIVKNFRSFDKDGIEIEFPDLKKPISIVGHNNSGKSNLINAILFGLNNKQSGYGAFDQNDFFNHDLNAEIVIEIHVNPTIKVPTIYNQFLEINFFQLKVKSEEGFLEVQHYCHDTKGKTIFTPMALSRGKHKGEFTEEERTILNEQLKKGAQTAYKWKDKVPLYYIDPINIHNQLRANKGSLLSKVLNDVRKEFESQSTKLTDKPGIFKHHIGEPNVNVFKKMLEYIEKQIIPTAKLEALTKQLKDTIKKELEITDDHFDLSFGLPPVEEFYKNLEFYIKEDENKPKLPISRFGNGFIFLFTISLFKAILESEKGGNIFIIEEPETFLHEHYQDYFYRILEKLAEQNQVIYTSHSKRFVNIFEPQTIIKLKTSGLHYSKIIHHPKVNLHIPNAIEEYKLKGIEDFALYLKTLEPNIGNIFFAKKVLIVEGPHDLLGYRTVLSNEFNLDYNNISIVAAWGKDSIISIIQICKLFEIEYFVIHDFDLSQECDITLSQNDSQSIYGSLNSQDKAQYTRNYKIATEPGIKNVHHNKPNLEGVLQIQRKGSASVYNIVSGRTIADITTQYPKFLSTEVIDFLRK